MDRLGETEVEHLDRAVGSDLDVRGFQVAVNDALLVRGFERRGNLPCDGERLVYGAAIEPASPQLPSCVRPRLDWQSMSPIRLRDASLIPRSRSRSPPTRMKARSACSSTTASASSGSPASSSNRSAGSLNPRARGRDLPLRDRSHHRHRGRHPRVPRRGSARAPRASARARAAPRPLCAAGEQAVRALGDVGAFAHPKPLVASRRASALRAPFAPSRGPHLPRLVSLRAPFAGRPWAAPLMRGCGAWPWASFGR